MSMLLSFDTGRGFASFMAVFLQVTAIPVFVCVRVCVCERERVSVCVYIITGGYM